MERKALVLYVRELRDLEIAKRIVEHDGLQEISNYDESIQKLQTPNYEEVPVLEKKSGIGPIVSIVAGISLLCFLVWVVMMGETSPQAGGLDVVLVAGMALALIVAGVYFLWGGIQETADQKKEIAAITEYNRSEDERMEKNKPVINRLAAEREKRLKYWNDQYSKIITLMTQDYNLNILPKPYRNLAALVYIYDYMSTSEESLQDTLLHEHMESGIQRVLERLDTIIAQNRVIIFQNRIAEARSQTLISQNSEMLSMLAKTEQNAAEAKQYAELAANYSEANAFFSMADYLKQ